MDAGVTGTQYGATQEQLRKVVFILARVGIDRLHHGDCVGVDAQVHELVRTLEDTIEIVGHPPDNPSKRAFKECDVWRRPLPYLERNHNIVDESDYVLGLPRGLNEELRSGTWATIRYARKVAKPLAVIFPDGSATLRNMRLGLVVQVPLQ